jgi:hypothetical protein|tara:strand:+ start:210 stop:506 length:297 start_codon:yes stop_codon:yes gene_type:complete
MSTELKVTLNSEELKACYKRSLIMCLETCYIHDDLIFDFQIYYQNHCETCKDERDNYMWGYEQDSDQDFVNTYIRSKGRKIIKKGFFEDKSNHGAFTL